MDPALVPLRAGLTAAAADELVVLLAAFGVAAEIDREPGGAATVLVAARELAAAGAILAEHGEADAADVGGHGRGAAEPPVDSTWRWTGPETSAVAALALVCVMAFFWTTGGALEASYGRMLDAGAVLVSRVDRGEMWRLAAAVFLHFDLAHLLANIGTLLLVGPILARVIGPLRFTVVFVGAGVAGNVASYLLAPSPALKAGASGAVAGVIGALAGQSLRAGRAGRFRRWQIVGALVAIYALLVGAGAGRDHVAHLGGLLAGVALGHWLSAGESGTPSSRRFSPAASSARR